MTRPATASAVHLFVTAVVFLTGCGASPPPASCARWEDGLATAARRSGGVVVRDRFPETVVTGPPAVLDRLAAPGVPPGCAWLVERVSLPALGERSWAYGVLDEQGIPLRWTAVIRGSSFVVEVTVPNHALSPRAEPRRSLVGLAREAYRRAVRDGSRVGLDARVKRDG